MIYVCIAEGFEEVEALTVVDVLRRGNILVNTVSMDDNIIVKGAHGICVEADLKYEDCQFDQCHMLVLPGGLEGTENLMAHKGLKDQLLDFAKNKKISAICAAPMVLGALGILQDKKATIYPGLEEKLIGATPTGENVTVDGNIITGMGPAKAMEFALAILENVAGKEVKKEVASDLLYK